VYKTRDHQKHIKLTLYVGKFGSKLYIFILSTICRFLSRALSQLSPLIYIPVFGFTLSFTTRFISEVYGNDQYLTHTRLPDSKDFQCFFIQLNLIPQTGNKSQRKYEISNLFLKTLSNGCYNVSMFSEGRTGVFS